MNRRSVARYIWLFMLFSLVFSCGEAYEVKPRAYSRIDTHPAESVVNLGGGIVEVELLAEIIHSGDFPISDHGFLWAGYGGSNRNISFESAGVSSISLGAKEGAGLFRSKIEVDFGEVRDYYSIVVRAYTKTGDYIVYGDPVLVVAN